MLEAMVSMKNIVSLSFTPRLPAACGGGPFQAYSLTSNPRVSSPSHSEDSNPREPCNSERHCQRGYLGSVGDEVVCGLGGSPWRLLLGGDSF